MLQSVSDINGIELQPVNYVNEIKTQPVSNRMKQKYILSFILNKIEIRSVSFI